MTNILAVDYGKAKIGLAISFGSLAEPYMVIKYKTMEYVLGKIEQIIRKEEVDRVVIGISEGKMRKESENFAELIKKNVNIEVATQDETLSTHQAIELSISSGIRQKKRRENEDAYAACVILQSYLDEKLT